MLVFRTPQFNHPRYPGSRRWRTSRTAGKRTNRTSTSWSSPRWRSGKTPGGTSCGRSRDVIGRCSVDVTPWLQWLGYCYPQTYGFLVFGGSWRATLGDSYMLIHWRTVTTHHLWRKWLLMYELPDITRQNRVVSQIRRPPKMVDLLITGTRGWFGGTPILRNHYVVHWVLTLCCLIFIGCATLPG